MIQKTALVTGACGFVGRHFVRRLLDLGYSVTAVDDLSTGLSLENWPEALKVRGAEKARFRFLAGDFREFAKEFDADFDLIIHLAAVVGGRLKIEGDPLAVATDLAIDATLFNWATKTSRPRKLLYFSSSAAYPIGNQTPEHNCPLREDMIDFRETIGVPDMTYGWSKLTGEFLARYAVETYDLDVAVYRPFSGYGEYQDFTYPFPSIVRRVVQQESPIVVWGSGKQMRDFIHIDDVVDAVFASYDRLAPGEALNLGSGVGTTFVELAGLACDVTGRQAQIVNDETKPEGVFARVAQADRMFRFHTPRVSLRQGVERTIEHQMRTLAVRV